MIPAPFGFIAALCPALILSTSLAAQDSRPSSRPAADAKLPSLERSRNGGYLGIFFHEVHSKRKRVGLRITAVQKGSDAERLGFLVGDEIVKVDGRPFKTGDDFIKALWFQRTGRMQKPKTGHAITVLRGGKSVKLKAGMEDLDASPSVGQKAPDFTLRGFDGKSERRLAKMVGDKPVVLVFGSYT